MSTVNANPLLTLEIRNEQLLIFMDAAAGYLINCLEAQIFDGQWMR
jgi:hypothetical protein